MTLLQQLLSTIREMIRAWYSVDRIRISPNEGRLLRLNVGDTFLLFDALYTVSQRRVESVDEGYKVICQLSNLAGNMAQLFIDATSKHTSTARLDNGKSARPVFDGDVVVLHHDYVSTRE